jgi:hypothetical protein
LPRLWSKDLLKIVVPKNIGAGNEKRDGTKIHSERQLETNQQFQIFAALTVRGTHKNAADHLNPPTYIGSNQPASGTGKRYV